MLKEPISLPTGYTIAVQREDGAPWMHGTVIEHGNEDQSDRLYKICITMSGHIFTRNIRHIKCIQITAEYYLK